ncbi:hypothetical protein BAE44_0026333 [Dichanthelium oligosanthes]|uniref:Uncharacterized protein n=1 Tax=Dichanthelium oligosanthes TaxID=888268 RepID=A0A1E5UIF2_9POAL|nr:hypothetical protein BAE44_0026333 [Dichanthelium oligosanthes]
MDPAGAPWCDPRRGYGGYGYGVGSAAQAPSMRRQPQLQQPASRPDAAAVAGGGVLKRSLGEVERWQQALYLRAVRQRVAAQAQAAHHHPPIDIGAVLDGPASRGSGFSGPSSTLSSLTTASRMATPPPVPVQQLLRRQMVAAPSAPPRAAQAVGWGPVARPATAREMALLQELERQLLGDDEEAEATGSACGSTVTSAAWGNTMQELPSITAAPLPSLPMASATNKNYNTVPISRSPTDSASSSTASSTASSSPPTSTASSWQLLSEAAAAVADGNRAAAAAHLAVLKTCLLYTSRCV